MDCNKDEALRAKEIAVRKFSEKDVIGAKKFAIKAQQLYPELEGISHLVANLDLHMAAKFRRNGEIDWYKVLGVSPSADMETITKQYRKMALTTHPDKNREAGSESAFKLLSEAFRILKDSATRSAYDRRVNIQTVQNHVPSQSKFVPVTPGAPQSKFVPVTPGAPTQAGGPPPPTWATYKHTVQTQKNHQQSIPAQCGFSVAPPHYQPIPAQGVFSTVSPHHQSAPTQGVFSVVPPNHKNCKKKSQAKGRASTSAASPNNGRSRSMAQKAGSSRSLLVSLEEDSFWTRCYGCKSRFEYFMAVKDHHVCCQICKVVFLATEISVPSTYDNRDIWLSKPSQEAGASGTLQAPSNGKPSKKGVKRGPNEEKGPSASGIKRQKSGEHHMKKH